MSDVVEVGEEPAIDVTSIPDRVPAPEMVKQVMEALKQSDTAAYTVYLKLSQKYAGR